METERKGDKNRLEATNPTSNSGGFGELMYERYRKAKENVEAYPYVWSSYVLVYSGFSLWIAYRYRKLRKTEDRVRVLQEKLRRIREERESASSVAASNNVAPSKSASSAANNVQSSKSASSTTVSDNVTSPTSNPFI